MTATLVPARHRRVARDISRIAAVFAGTMLALTVGSMFDSGRSAAAAPINGGAALLNVPPGPPTAGLPLLSGGSATPFALTPPVGASCTGDTASGGYRVQTYMVPASVDPATLTFGADGPAPAGVGAALRQPLFANGTPFVQQTTSVASEPGGGGLLTGLQAFSFDVFGAEGPQIVPPGTYNIGYACTIGSPSATQLDKYWNVQLTFAASSTDEPAGITWRVVANTGSTTTVPGTTTTTVVAATTTTVRPTTTTTAAAMTTTTGSTTTLLASAAPTSTLASSFASTGFSTSSGSGSGGGNGSAIPVTGPSHTVRIAFWALLLLAFGRMAVLMARPIRVLPPDAR